MELEIEQMLLDRADRCANAFRCLRGILSDAEPQLTGRQRFVCRDPYPCAYKIPFGSSFFCNCPVRAAIFEKHRV
jgi:hypothetical protein